MMHRPENTLRLPAHRNPVPTSTRVITRRLPLSAYVAVVVAVPVLIILGARASGWWIPQGHTVTSSALGAASLGVAEDREGGGGGESVKGSMTIAQVLEAFPGVTAEDLYRRAGVPGDTPTSTPVRELMNRDGGLDMPTLRAWLETRGI